MSTTRSGSPVATLGGQARRAQLVECAVQALGEVGFAGTSIAEVARRAGVSKGVVTYHFPSKEDLLGEVVASLYGRAGRRIEDRIATEDTALGVLVGYIKANLAFVAEHTAHVRAVMEIAANLRRQPPGPAGWPAADDPVAAHLQTLIQRGLDDGEFAPLDARVLATVIRAAIDAAAARAATEPGFDHDRFSRGLVLFVRRSVEARP